MTSKIPPVLKPVNRHLTIVPHPSKSREVEVLLPEGYEPEEDPYIVASVVDVAPDCAPSFRQLRGSGSRDRVIVVDRSMVQEIAVNDKTYYTVLENYIVGILRGLDES